jgi:glycosyltransferase involved in cell wall biosynthesis
MNSINIRSEHIILVSAIVSTYNSESFLRGCLEDLTEQTLFVQGVMEIIVVDSASLQNEGVIVRSFIDKFGCQITYIRTDVRETIYQAWNRGIRSAHGRYVTNANTDDRHRIDALERMAATLDVNHNVALVYGDCFVTNFPNQTFENHIRCGYHVRPDYSPEIMLSGCHIGPQPMWLRSVHDEVGFFSEELVSAGDYEFWCRIARKYSLLHIPQFLGLYYENPRGFANSDTALSVRESQQVQCSYADAFPAPQRDYANNIQFWGEVPENGYAHICLLTHDDVASFAETLESLVRYTEYPHVITVADMGSSAEMAAFLSAAKHAGIIKNLVMLGGDSSFRTAVEAAADFEREALFRLVLGNKVRVCLPGWLSLLVIEVKKGPAFIAFTNRVWIRDGLIREIGTLLPMYCMDENPSSCFSIEWGRT